jgi:hypothetical protein
MADVTSIVQEAMAWGREVQAESVSLTKAFQSPPGNSLSDMLAKDMAQCLAYVFRDSAHIPSEIAATFAAVQGKSLHNLSQGNHTQSLLKARSELQQLAEANKSKTMQEMLPKTLTLLLSSGVNGAYEQAIGHFLAFSFLSAVDLKGPAHQRGQEMAVLLANLAIHQGGDLDMVQTTANRWAEEFGFRQIVSFEDMRGPGKNDGGKPPKGGPKGKGDDEFSPEVEAAERQAYIDEAEKDTRELPELLAELDGMVGMQNIKDQVRDLMATCKLRARRKEAGFKNMSQGLHLVFTGNPGTGKTTVARLIAKIYRRLGVLEVGHCVEVDRGGLVGGFVGHTALKTGKRCRQADGGVLFIDEAYALAKGGEKDFGQEAVETVLKFMEDKRDSCMVIVAGYPELMKNFIASNPGLESRFNTYLPFHDYTPSECLEIFDHMTKAADFTISGDGREALLTLVQDLHKQMGKDWGNGRTVRNVFEKLQTRLAKRLDADGVFEKLDGMSTEDAKRVLAEFTVEDVKSIDMKGILVESAEKGLGYMGFIPPGTSSEPQPEPQTLAKPAPSRPKPSA